jgi:SAM-dependent methyltransferase
MKTRESGMPEEKVWEAFFQPEVILERLGLRGGVGDVAEFGCGYGTFTIPAARRSRGMVYAYDIDPEMVAATGERAASAAVANVRVIVRDFVARGTGLAVDCVEYVMLFNILHAEQPGLLLAEAWRILIAGGLLGIIHWNYDPATPRGPNMNIRPCPEQCRDWAIHAGFRLRDPGIISLPPYHYGLALEKPTRI